MKIAISVETAADFSKELIEKYDLKVIPFGIVHGDNLFKDGDMTTEELLDLAETSGILPKTNAVNEFEYTEHFENILKDYDAIVHFALSSGISSACSNAIRAAKEFDNVYVVDTLSLAGGIACLALYAKDLANQGLDAKEVYEKSQARVKDIVTTFVIEKLNYLYKGGRCNSLQLLGANLLKLRPRIALIDGVMKNDKKYRGGMASVISKYAEDLFTENPNPDLTRIAISYSTATEEMLKTAREACQNLGFKEIIELPTGATITSHCGQNTVGILFMNKN